MEELKNEQTEQTSQTTEVEEVQGEAESEVSLGKFKDVGALLSAYKSLQSEFTKRCQKVKELESALSSVDKNNLPTETVETPEQKENITDEEKKNILKDYLTEIMGKKQSAIIMDGGVGVRTPIDRPKTVEQAGMLAKEILK